MRIDAAVQFCDRSQFAYPWMERAAPHMRRDFAADDLWRILARNKYDAAVACAMLDTPEETDWLLNLSDRNPWIAGVLAHGAAKLDQWQRHPRFRGVWVAMQEGSAGLWRELESRDLACDLVVTPDQLPLAAEVAGAAPGLRLAVAHLGRPEFGRDFEFWARQMEAVAAAAHVMVKISGLINDASPDGWKAETYRPYIQHLMSVVGPGRLMYGSDWPRCMHTGTWKESMAAFTQALGAQSIETRALVLGENANRHYGLAITR